MAEKIIEDLGTWDWDDSALIRAYERGMTLNVKDSHNKCRKSNKQDSKKTDEFKWKVGDCCRAEYSGDGLMYEAKIISVHDDYCVVEYLGYDEEAEVDYESLEKSQGKKAQKKQILSASSNYPVNNADGYVSGSGDDVGSDAHRSPHRRHSSKKHHHKKHRRHMLNQQADYTAASFAVDSVYPFHQHNIVPVPQMHPLPPPPAPECSEIASNPSLRAMLTSWYMAGYYTGLHQAEKRQQRQCQASHNYY